MKRSASRSGAPASRRSANCERDSWKDESAAVQPQSSCSSSYRSRGFHRRDLPVTSPVFPDLRRREACILGLGIRTSPGVDSNSKMLRYSRVRPGFHFERVQSIAPSGLNKIHSMKTRIGLPAIALAAFLSLGLPLASSSAEVVVSVGIAPPLIPVYVQPLCPGPGYIWVPGYWAYDGGYYWVPGEWVLPPRIGFLWTPGYWGYSGSSYVFNEGYWGPSVGFYGGINYGYGYYGSDYHGGRWVGDTFHYNTAVSRVNTKAIRNTYVDRQVLPRDKGAKGKHLSFNGPGGVQAEPNEREKGLANAEHVAPNAAQQSRVAAAKNDPALRVADNKGQPKANAVRSFESKHRSPEAETAAAAKNDHSVKAARNERVATSREHKAKQARKSGSRKVAKGSHAVRHQKATAKQRQVAWNSRVSGPHRQRATSHQKQAKIQKQRGGSHPKRGGKKH